MQNRNGLDIKYGPDEGDLMNVLKIQIFIKVAVVLGALVLWYKIG